MPNLSQMKRKRMLEFLDKIKEEHKNDDEMLIALGEIENELNSKKYGLVWEEHEEKVDVQMRTHIPVFTEVKEREISAAPEKPYNFLLEGDNLHSLYLLEKTHKGKIDVIYIDPPYNTGGSDFRYEDAIVSKEDGFRHSKWVSFMQCRLNIARELLSENGVIFISIDDNEMAALLLLCDEIFGQENRVETIIWKNKYGAGAKTVGFISVHEYILCYSKKPIKDLTSELDEEGQAAYNKKDEKFETRGGYLTQPLMTTSLGDRPNLVYDIEYDGDIITPRKQWVWSRERLESAIQNNEVEFNKQKDGTYSVRAKKYLYDEFGNIRRGKPITIFNGPFTQDGTKEIREHFGTEDTFKFAKPSELIRKLIAFEINGLSSKNAIVLDFFAGSGTTAQAVLEQNKRDGGNRTFILCTNNEQDICESVTYKRILNLINGYADKDAIPANLKYYRTDFVSRDEEFLSDALLEHIAEMIQLEHGVKIDGSQYRMIMSDEEADNLQKHFGEYGEIKAVYVSKNVLLTAEQKRLFQNIEIHIIPDNYFSFELREEEKI
ncbi:MAG: site-specific DNA-methyltransferase [Roseburia sp.]|nr:site-specific DNA-methyltransferase [Roseburia sp.]